jgi:hypothetical protein
MTRIALRGPAQREQERQDYHRQEREEREPGAEHEAPGATGELPALSLFF